MSAPTVTYTVANHYISNCEYGDPLVVSRLHRVPAGATWRLGVLGAIFGIAIIIYFIAFLCFIIRIRSKPLKERSPFLLLVSAFAGTLALFYMYSRLFFDLVWVCPITYYVVIIALLLFFLPYILRCYRTLMMWRFYQLASMEKEDPKAKAEAEKAMNPCTAVFSKINGLINHVAVYRKFLYSELFLCLFTAAVFIVCLLTAIILQVILATSPAHVFDPVCQKTCNSHEGIALKVLSIFSEIAIFVYLGLVILMKNINDEFSIRNELLVLCLFSFVTVTVMVIVQFVPATAWPEQPYIGYVLGVELVGSFIISVCYPLFKSFTRNIFLSDVLPCLKTKRFVDQNGSDSQSTDQNASSTTGAPANDTTAKPVDNTPAPDTQQPTSPAQPAPVQPTPVSPQDNQPLVSPSDTPSDSGNNASSSTSGTDQAKPDEPAPQQPTAPVAEQPKNVDEPKPVEEPKPDAPKKITKDDLKQPKAAVNTVVVTNKEFEEFLTKREAKDVFKQFLVREFSVENLMFYTEVQFFKQQSEAEEIKETAQQIYDTYVCVGAPFEINIPSDKRTGIEQTLKKAPIPLDAFGDAEKIVYTFMEKESFPRFQKNKLYSTYQDTKTKASSSSGAKKPPPSKKPPPKK